MKVFGFLAIFRDNCCHGPYFCLLYLCSVNRIAMLSDNKKWGVMTTGAEKRCLTF